MTISDTLFPRRLGESDAVSGFNMSTEAGWNQTEHDWTVMIRTGQGIGLVDSSDQFVATSILVPFLPDVDWVSMVLVTTPWRMKGVGSRLMRLVTELSPNPILGLDATDQGLALYKKLGFVATEEITRYRRTERVDSGNTDNSDQIVSVTREQFPELLIPFASRADESRRRLLQQLDTTSGGMVCMVRGDSPVSLASIRPGRVSNQIGPLFATDAASAVGILKSIVASRGESLIIDVPDRHTAFSAQLPLMGFQPVRTFVRMFKGGLPPPNPFEYAIAGPEFG
ncbi:hypothetical protein ACFLRO_01955 [Bacteroidota bacterium]